MPEIDRNLAAWKRFSDESGVPQKEVFEFLTVHGWDYETAMAASAHYRTNWPQRSDTVESPMEVPASDNPALETSSTSPIVTDSSPTEVPVSDESTPDVALETSSTPPIAIDATPISSIPSNSPPIATDATPISSLPPNPPPGEQPTDPREVLRVFVEFVATTDLERARRHLEHWKWNLDRAFEHWYDDSRQSPSTMTLNLPMHGTSATLAMLSPDELCAHIPSSQVRASGSSSSGILRAGERIPRMASSQVNNVVQNVQENRGIRRIECPDRKDWVDLIIAQSGVTRLEAVFCLENSNWDFDVGMREACRKKARLSATATSLPQASMRERSTMAEPSLRIGSPRTSLPRVLMRERSTMAARPLPIGPPRISNAPEHPPQLTDDAINKVCEVTRLSRDRAITCLQVSNYDAQQAINIFMNHPEMFTEEDISMQVPSQPQIQASDGSSSSSVSAGPTETESSQKEAGEKSATVATPGIESSQVEPVEANLGAEVVNMEILPGGEGVREPIVISVGLDQTVRDIRIAIRNQLPGDNREYYLISSIGGREYRDLNCTVREMLKRKCGMLLQIFCGDN